MKRQRSMVCGVALKRHDEGADRVPEQREGEDRAAAEAVRQPAEGERADEHAGEAGRDQAREALQVEQARRGRFEQAFLEQPDRHIGRKEQIVELEPGAERKKRDQPARMPRRRQAIEPRGDRNDGRVRGRIGSHACPPRSGPTCARTFM